MKRRCNPATEQYQYPGDPYGDEDIGPLMLTIENTEDLYLLEKSTLVKLAQDAVAGKYISQKALTSWEKLTRMAMREYRRSGGERLSKRAEWATAVWLEQWAEHLMFGSGMASLLRISQGELDF